MQKEKGLSLKKFWQQAHYWAREYFGENAYARYVAQWQAEHANLDETELQQHQPLMSAREFFQYQLDLKYNPKMQRC